MSESKPEENNAGSSLNSKTNIEPDSKPDSKPDSNSKSDNIINGKKADKSVILAVPRGFCAGVDRAILTVSRLLENSAAEPKKTNLPPVYVRRQIVHNRHVVADLSERGAVFVNELDEIPDEAAEAKIPVVFSAHGVSPAVVEEAQRRGLNVIDATCPLVGKVHREVLRYAKEGYSIVYIGHKGHDEAIGVIGEAPENVTLVQNREDVKKLVFPDGTPLVCLSQTTLSAEETEDTVAALKKKFPSIKQPSNSDICYATHNRQAAIKQIAEKSSCVIVVGSQNSSNSVRLVEVAQQELANRGKAFLVDDAEELKDEWFENAETVGVSSGASVPDVLVDEVVLALKKRGFKNVKTLTAVEENMHFVLPKAVR